MRPGQPLSFFLRRQSLSFLLHTLGLFLGDVFVLSLSTVTRDAGPCHVTPEQSTDRPTDTLRTIQSASTGTKEPCHVTLQLDHVMSRFSLPLDCRSPTVIAVYSSLWPYLCRVYRMPSALSPPACSPACYSQPVAVLPFAFLRFLANHRQLPDFLSEEELPGSNHNFLSLPLVRWLVAWYGFEERCEDS